MAIKFDVIVTLEPQGVSEGSSRLWAEEMDRKLLAIDQGTTSSRAIVFTPDLSVLSSSQMEFAQHFPADGWVEHDAEDIWQTTIEVCRSAMNKAGVLAKDIASIGITNQRETTLVWNRGNRKADQPGYRLAGPQNSREMR